MSKRYPIVVGGLIVALILSIAISWKMQRDLKRKQKELESAENTIHMLEGKKSVLTAELINPDVCADYKRSYELSQELERLEEELFKLYQSWEQLQEELYQLEAE